MVKIKNLIVLLLISTICLLQAASPVVTSTAVSGVNENSVYSYTLMGTDSDGDSLVWKIKDGTSLPSWLTLNQSWEALSADGASKNAAAYASMAIDSNDIPYVAYTDGGHDNKASMVKFNGTTWEQVGSEGFSEGFSIGLSMAINSTNTPYVVYKDRANSDKANVMKFNGTAWEQVGNANFSPGRIAFSKIVFDSNDIPYVAYRDDPNNGASVMKLNGTTWEQVGDIGFAEGSTNNIELVIDSNDILYIAYQEYSSEKKISVMKFNGTAWEQVGPREFSSGANYNIGIGIDNHNIPYVAYDDKDQGYKASVMKFNGTSWEFVGSAGVTPNRFSDISITFDNNNIPYIAYTDGSAGYKASAMKFNGTTWEQVGNTGFSVGRNQHTKIIFNSKNIPYVMYQDEGISDKADVSKLGPLSLEGTPTSEQIGDYNISLILSDGSNEVAHNFTISVHPLAPTITSTAIKSVAEDNNYSYELTASDAQGDELNWSVRSGTSLPTWLSLNSSTTVSTFAGSGSSGSANGDASSASFNSPTGVAVDSTGNVYVIDGDNHLIRKIDINGQVTTIAGTGSTGSANGNGTSASFNNPKGIAVDSSGNIYIADHNNHLIRKIDTNGAVTTYAGSGSAGSTNANGTSASFNQPSGLVVDSSGNVYVSDYSNHLIRKIDTNGDVTTIAGSGSAGSTNANGTSASFNYPFGVAVDDSGNVYVSDKENHLIRKIDNDGNVTTLAGSGDRGSDNGNGTSASFNKPKGVAYIGGNVYVLDQYSHKIRKIDKNGNVTTLAGSGNQGSSNGEASLASFKYPQGLAVDSNGNVYVAGYRSNLIRKIETKTKLIGTPTNSDVGVEDVNLSLSDGTNSVEHNFQITVTNTNDIPTSSDLNITMPEDTNKTFSVSDFPFIDEDVGDSLDAISITSLVNKGNLRLSGNEVSLNQDINISDINNLVFTPVANANGTPYTTFGFKVNDGEVNSTSSYIATINVSAVNDTPIWSMSDSSVDINDTLLTKVDLSGAYSDIDTSDIITITPVSSNTTIATVAMDGDILVITPQDGQSGVINIDLNISDGTTSISESLSVTIQGETSSPDVVVPGDDSDGEFDENEEVSGTKPNVQDPNEYKEIVTKENITYAIYSDADHNGKLSIMKKIDEDNWEYISSTYTGYGNAIATQIDATYNKRRKLLTINFKDNGSTEILKLTKGDL